MVSYPKKSSAEWFIDQLNVENAKLVAFVLVIGFIGYHGILHLRYGPDSCTWLLTSGRYKGDHEWQPYGCMLHRYSKTDARRCLRYLAFWGKYNSFAFIGDSRVEQLYEYFIGVLKTRLDLDSSYSTIDHHMPNYTYVDHKLRLSVSFVWSNDVSKTMVEQFRHWQYSDKPPSVIVASTGLQLLATRNTTDLVLEEYKRNLTRLVQPIDSLSIRDTKVLWKLLEPVDSNKKNVKISNTDIDAYNRAAIEILTHSAAKIWNSPRLVSQGAMSDDGTLLSDTALRHCAQILLNMFCNDHMNFNDGSCCAAPEPYTRLQMVTQILFVVCAVLSSAKKVWQWAQTLQQRLGGYSLVNQAPVAPPSPLAALGKLGMIMAYFYLCDRTNFFMKENKYYSEWSFWLPVGYVFALGLFFTDDSRSSRVLHREQTNEWKGWMQLVILVYQVTGASKVLPIYMLVRALVSAYLFLTGYGHLYYMWQTGDAGLVRYFRVMFKLNFLTVVLCLAMNRPYQFYSFIPLVSFCYEQTVSVLQLHTIGFFLVYLVRYFRVMFKLNFLTVVLCLAMNRPYQFYSFIPLVSFWYTLFFVIFALPPHITKATSHTVESKPYQYLYIVVKIIGLLIIFFVIFALPPHITKATSHTVESKPYQYLYIVVKIIGLLTIVTVLYMSEVFFQKIFVTRPWKALFVNADDDIHQWWLQWKQDRYSMAYGIIFAMAYLLAQRYNLLDDKNHSNLFTPGVSLTATLLAFIGIGSYVTFTFFCTNIFDCNEIHSYVAWLPIVSYIILRNISGALRTRHSTHEIHKLTGIILPYAVPDDWRLVLRNFAIFLAILVPIGIHDGMF
ncbi:10 TM acyl transferase domain found in cas1p domain-containing protein [Phthorimaea operculella]|nr:10 TM acyl transferase domain found in cas1p domain-containing protein [Phthorimaea operculella]